MQIVIKIPEEYYNDICNSETASNYSVLYALDRIRNGTPLPKGHGDLKDVDRIFNEGFPEADINAEYYENIKKYPLWRTDISGIQSIFKNAPTIIEADTESEERNG